MFLKAFILKKQYGSAIHPVSFIARNTALTHKCNDCAGLRSSESASVKVPELLHGISGQRQLPDVHAPAQPKPCLFVWLVAGQRLVGLLQ